MGTVPVLTLFFVYFSRNKNFKKLYRSIWCIIDWYCNQSYFICVCKCSSCYRLLPVTGLPMPMVSYGGSGMIINMSLMGILLNISQSKEL